MSSAGYCRYLYDTHSRYLKKTVLMWCDSVSVCQVARDREFRPGIASGELGFKQITIPLWCDSESVCQVVRERNSRSGIASGVAVAGVRTIDNSDMM